MDENSVSFSNVLNSVLFYYTWFRKPNLVSVFKQCQSNTQMSVVLFVFLWESMRRSQNRVKKNLHKALCLVQFAVSLTCFWRPFSC